ncbi:MAG TPA: restriction endonuclease subunit S [Verrucomicrobiae bacterium]
MPPEPVDTPYGFVSSRFQCAKLADLCVNESGVQTGPFGSQLHQEDYVPQGIPILTVEHLGENRIIHDDLPRVSDSDRARLARYSLQTGDIVFSRVGSVDRRALVRDEENGWLFSGRCLRVRPDSKKIDSQYLSSFFGFEGFREHVRRIAVGATMPSLNTKLLSDLPIYFPELAEQQAIAAVLGSLDDKIELNRRMNETLEALAQSLFKSWFVDATQSALPKGWTERALYDCADYINGAAFRNEHFSADRQGLPVIKIGELKDGITAQTKFCEIEREPKYRINSGEILFSWSGSPDTSIDIFIWTEGEGWLNQHIFKIQFKRPVEKFFVYYLLRHLKPVFVEIARDKQTTGLGHVTGQDLKRLRTFFPTDDVLEKFNCIVEPLFQKVYSNLHESRTLAALRDALLPKLLSGELPVPAKLGSLDL